MVHSKVLLVDDDLDDHEIFSIALQEAHKPIEVVRAYDGVEALAYLHEEENELPDFIFLYLLQRKTKNGFCSF